MKRACLFSSIFLLLIAGNIQALTIEERVDAQRAIERVYYNHRIWPNENPGPKPPFEVILPEASLRAKVEDYLQKSDALDRYWQHPITAQQLQAEMNRMVKETKQPAVLRELFAALSNDPQLIAECLARPILADRLIHNMYAGDERFHGALKRQVESELAITNTIEAMRALSGSYRESVWKRNDTGDKHPPSQDADGSISLDPQEWKEWTNRLQQKLGEVPVMKLSRLQEDTDRYYVIALLERADTSLRLATVEWKKQSFDEWWKDAKLQARAEIVTPVFAYALSGTLPASTPDVDDTWSSMSASSPPTERESHTAVWTGSEMIVWGGLKLGMFNAHNTGGRYDPATENWEPTTTTGAPPASGAHTAVWTGQHMIVWGGYDSGSFLNTGGRYDPTTDGWILTSTSNAPPGRNQATAVWTGTEMIVWGGYSGSDVNTGGRYNPSTNNWAAGGTSTTNAPSARSDHTALWTGSRMLVWGGGALNTGGRYNPVSDSWDATTTTGAPPPSSGLGVWTGGEMVVWSDWSGSGGRYNPQTDSWLAMNMAGAPEVRGAYSSVWTGSEMIVWGGAKTGVMTNTGGRYNPITDTWKAGGTSTVNAPTGRYRHTAVWTGTEMIVWGGYDNVTPLNTGGRYMAVEPCLFCDDFEDGVLDPDWTYIKPAWNETGGNLIGTPTRKAIAVATPAFAGCQVCAVEADMRTAGGIGNNLSLLGWYVDKKNNVELLLKEEKNKMILKQRLGGVVVKKQAAAIAITPNVNYDVKIAFDGSQFVVSVDSVNVMTVVPAGAVPTGTVGFQAKNTIGTFGSINVQ